MALMRRFDYVVVGGGAAGCVLAARIAKAGHEVALVERGRADTNRWIHIPATFFRALQGEDAEIVTGEPHWSVGERAFPVPQARVLGGGSSINGMIYMRGQAADYEGWQDTHGCDGWRYGDVLPAFTRQEKNTRLSGLYHGTVGQMVVADPVAPHKVSARAIQAAREVGIPAADDFNGASQEGAGWYQVMAHRGRRQSAATCFLKPEIGRENLTILTDTFVERVRFEGRRAVAIEARDGPGHELLLEAEREIILSGGAFQSPKMLMLSGIGPSDLLKRFGIDVVHDAPEVGANYQDHVGVPVTRHLRGRRGLHGQNRGLAAVKNAIAYYGFRRGVMASNLLDAGACVDSTGDGRPDLQFNFAPFAPGAPGEKPLEAHAMQVHPMVMRPSSRGRVSLTSNDPWDALRFEAGALTRIEDVEALRRGVRIARQMFEAGPLREIVGDEIWPGAGVSDADGTEAFDDAIRAHARTIYHPCGTCRMGPMASSVVDMELRVNGVEGLRVADASVMPQIVSGNTCAPVMMIAERAAEFILSEN